MAVLPVMLFHAGFTAFSGGFAGVDVFFVISGYLITSIILAEQAAGTFSLARFYERRARRILPALFLVMFACLPFAWAWLVPADLKDFSASLVAVPTFASNILFYMRSGYFTPAAELNPLLHTWSLAVEEQYYLLFPLFLLLLWRVRKQWAPWVLAFGAAASLAVAQWGSLAYPTAAFYLLPTRGWELLIGALTALYLTGRNDTSGVQAGSRVVSPLVGESLSIVGVLLIGYAICAFDRETPYPGLYALAPTVGAALIILFATEQTLVGKLLGMRLLVGVGLISYSAYLWHQPLFAFARQRASDEPGGTSFLALTALALLLAYLTWKYVETPFRKGARVGRKPLLVFGLACSALFVVLGLVGQARNGFESRAPLLTQVGALKTVEDSRCHTLERRTVAQLAQGDVCTLGNGTVPTFAVIGDSHAGAVFEAIGAWPSDSPFAFFAVSGSFCAPVLNGFTLTLKFVAKDCVATTAEAFNQVLRSPTIRDVFLVAEWASYTQGYRDAGDGMTSAPATALDNEGRAGSVNENKIILLRSLARTVEALKSAGKNVIIVEPVPEFRKNVIRTISRHALLGDSHDASLLDLAAIAPSISMDDYRARNAEVFEVFSGLRDVSFIDTPGLFCDSNTCRSATREGDILFSDTNHLTENGARRLAAQMMKLVGVDVARSTQNVRSLGGPVRHGHAHVTQQGQPLLDGPL